MKKPVNNKKDKDKKSFKTYLGDFKKISVAGSRLLKYVLKITPFYTWVYLITIIALAITPFVSIWADSKIIDELVRMVTEGGDNTRTLFTFIGVALLVSAVDNLIGGINSIIDVNMWFEIGKNIDFDVVKKMAHLDLEHYDDPETNDKINKVRQNMRARPQNFLTRLFYLIQVTVSAISALYIFLFFSPLIILITVITALPLLFINMVFGRRSWGIWDAKGDINRDYNWSRSFLMKEWTLMELRVSKARDVLLKRIRNLYDSFQKEQMKLQSKRHSVQYFSYIFSLIGRAVSYLIIVFAVIGTRITIGQFNFYSGALSRLRRSLKEMMRMISRIYEDGLFLVDMYEFLDLEEKIVNGNVSLDKNLSPYDIEFKKVSFYYPAQKEKDNKVLALDKLSLKIEPGEHLAIVGENGAGKSTLIKLLLRFYDTSKGDIIIDNTNIKDVNLDTWYSDIGVLFQNYNFYHFSARENIRIGDPEKPDKFERIVEAAKKSQAHRFIDKYDNKYDQIMDKSFKGGISPSAGQRQRIALARTFFKDPSLLIMDEPTSAIDPKAEYEIFENLFKFAEGKTVIIVSHRFSTVRNAHRIIVMEEGKIVEEGTHEELMKIKGGRYKNSFELQSKGYK